MTGLQWRAYKRGASKKKDDMRRNYERLAQPVETDKPYIFVPLAYQPERTTSPNGGFYVHQNLIIDLLARAMPEGWWIYIKENPAQFAKSGHGGTHGERSREPVFYKDILRLKNVRFVSLSESTYDVLDSARAVATVTGTAGWEAVARGKPALIFGEPWYLGCEGTYPVKSAEDCKAAIESIVTCSDVDQGKVKLFLKCLEECAYKGYINPKFAYMASTTAENNIANISRAILDTAGMGEVHFADRSSAK